MLLLNQTAKSESERNRPASVSSMISLSVSAFFSYHDDFGKREVTNRFNLGTRSNLPKPAQMARMRFSGSSDKCVGKLQINGK